jgi:hypothetical protein
MAWQPSTTDLRGCCHPLPIPPIGLSVRIFRHQLHARRLTMASVPVQPLNGQELPPSMAPGHFERIKVGKWSPNWAREARIRPTLHRGQGATTGVSHRIPLLRCINERLHQGSAVCRR